MVHPQPTVAILTALPLEYQAVLSLLTDVEEETHPNGTIADLGTIPGAPWRVALLQTGPGTLSAAALTERVNSWLRPEAALFVGIAGGLKPDIGIGDVVVATKTYGIQGGKQTPEGFLVRPESWGPSHRLLQAATRALGERAHFKPIAVGDVVLAHARSAISEHLRLHYNDAVAIEMEGSGFAHAAHLTGELEALSIRGISDQANEEKQNSDAGGGQLLAAKNAAEAAIALLTRLKPSSGNRPADPSSGGAQYGGDHIDFRGARINGNVTGKQTGAP